MIPKSPSAANVTIKVTFGGALRFGLRFGHDQPFVARRRLLEPNPLESANRDRMRHREAVDQTRAVVLDAAHHHAEVDADHVWPLPLPGRVDPVAEAEGYDSIIERAIQFIITGN